MIRSYDMGYISTRMMECEDAFSDMGSLKQNLELPPEYAYDDGALPGSRQHWRARELINTRIGRRQGGR